LGPYWDGERHSHRRRVGRNLRQGIFILAFKRRAQLSDFTKPSSFKHAGLAIERQYACGFAFCGSYLQHVGIPQLISRPHGTEQFCILERPAWQ
jgi:hypothetical protein